MDKNTTANIEIVYPKLELLDEESYYSNIDLVREINKLRKELWQLKA